MHPKQVIHLEHDGKVLLVDDEGNGPMKPVQGRNGGGPNLRFPTLSEVESLGLPVQQKGTTVLRFGEDSYEVLKGYPKIDWPKNWAWKDNCIADNCVHPVAREAIYRSLHRLVSKVMVQNSNGDVLMAKVERGHFH